MEWKRIIDIIRVISFSLIFLFILSQLIYAEQSNEFYSFNSEINFKENYEYQTIKYSYINEENIRPINHLIKRYASINQNGRENESKICQIGINNSIVEIIQMGNKNRAEVKQYANSTKAEIFQFGNNHKVNVEQWRSGGTVYVIQSGNNYEDKEINIVQF